MLLKKISLLDSIDKYTYWLISKFMPITKKARFIFD